MNKANDLLDQIKKLENELEIFMLSNCSLNDLEQIIEIQNLISEKNILYMNMIEKEYF